jgi:hypothetical protein
MTAPAGLLTVPPGARAVVVFAEDRRDSEVAEALVRAGLANLLVDPVGEQVVEAIDQLAADALVGDLPTRLLDAPCGCFGTGAGAAAVLFAAVQRPDRVAAVVVRAAAVDLGRASAPTLLIPDDAAQVATLARDWFVRHLDAALQRPSASSR